MPGIEAKIWRSEDWENIAILAEENWQNKRDLKTLHNWIVAIYYLTQIDNNIENLLVSFSTAIANIDIDPSLVDLPWLGDRSISLADVRARLWKTIEQQIELIKDSDLSRYLHLRDRNRQEFWAIKLARTEPNARILAGELTIPPACYQRYYSQIPLGEELQVWKTLYTNWGTAVAACLAGDPLRAETIRVGLAVNSSLEGFAQHFILCEQGCYYLQQENWHSAIYPLDQIAKARKFLMNPDERIIADYLSPVIPLVKRFRTSDFSDRSRIEDPVEEQLTPEQIDRLIQIEIDKLERADRGQDIDRELASLVWD